MSERSRTVLVVGRDETASKLRRADDGYEVVTATDESELDGDVEPDVALVAETAVDDVTTFRSRLCSGALGCAVGLLQSTASNAARDAAADGALSVPATQSEVRTFVGKLAARAELASRVQNCFSLAWEKAELRRRHSEDELETLDSYATLANRLDRERARLDACLGRLPNETAFEAALESGGAQPSHSD